jgi:hypothetical protein
MENLHIIKTSYLGATNTRGARVKIYSERFRQSVVIPYNYRFNSALDIVINWLQSKGFEIIGKGEGVNNMYVISTTFEQINTRYRERN